MKLAVIAIVLTNLVVLAFGSLESLAQKKMNNNQTTIVDNRKLSKKWKLSHYIVFGTIIEPEEIEKNDYMHFYENLSYKSVSEGKYETGKYKIDKSCIILSDSTEIGELKLIITTLTEDILEVIIDDPSDSEAKYLTIHFIN